MAVNHLIRCRIILTLLFLDLLDRIHFATFTAFSDFKGPLGIKSFILTADVDRTDKIKHVRSVKHTEGKVYKIINETNGLESNITCFNNFLFSHLYANIGLFFCSLFIITFSHVVDPLNVKSLNKTK